MRSNFCLPRLLMASFAVPAPETARRVSEPLCLRDPDQNGVGVRRLRSSYVLPHGLRFWFHQNGRQTDRNRRASRRGFVAVCLVFIFMEPLAWECWNCSSKGRGLDLEILCAAGTRSGFLDRRPTSGARCCLVNAQALWRKRNLRITLDTIWLTGAIGLGW